LGIGDSRTVVESKSSFDILLNQFQVESAGLYDGSYHLGLIEVGGSPYWALSVHEPELAEHCYLMWPQQHEANQRDRIVDILGNAHPIYLGTVLRDGQMGLTQIAPWEEIPPEWLPDREIRLSNWSGK
jgi:hypothetical protein